LWPARRTRSRRSSHVVHDTAPIPGIIIPGARGKDLHPAKRKISIYFGEYVYVSPSLEALDFHLSPFDNIT
jgi:hypothetical protein